MSTPRHGRRPTSSPRRDRHLRAVDTRTADDGADELLHAVARALADPQPLTFLSLASAVVASQDPRICDPADHLPDGYPEAATFLDVLIGQSTPETTALLLAFAAFLPDNYLAQRARQEARARCHALPEWLLRLEEATPGRAVAAVDVLGDGENAVVSAQLPGGHALTAVVYIDHNLGTVVKDAFLIPEGSESYRRYVTALADTPEGLYLEDLAPAEARARIVQAIDMGTAVPRRLETESWPSCRPVVEWIIGRLPGGGTGFRWAEWTEPQRSSIAADFMRSPEAGDLTGPYDGKISLDLLRFTTDYSGGDPLRWSSVNVEILLTDWYPRMVPAEELYLQRMPAVLRALVRYAHRQREIPEHLTLQTLQTVDMWEPVYLDLANGRGPHGTAFLAPAAGFYGDELMGQWTMDPRDLAAHCVGGEERLAELDDAPLPQEEFRWGGIPEDVRARVAEVLRMCDDCATELFDTEMRTAFRRVLARTAATDPAVFRRRSKDSTAAAAIAWAVATVNNRFSPYDGGLTAKALLAHFGVTGSVLERARPFLRAFGAEEWQPSGRLTFGTPEVLTSGRRAELVGVRESTD